MWLCQVFELVGLFHCLRLRTQECGPTGTWARLLGLRLLGLCHRPAEVPRKLHLCLCLSQSCLSPGQKTQCLLPVPPGSLRPLDDKPGLLAPRDAEVLVPCRTCPRPPTAPPPQPVLQLHRQLSGANASGMLPEPAPRWGAGVLVPRRPGSFQVPPRSSLPPASLERPLPTLGAQLLTIQVPSPTKTPATLLQPQGLSAASEATRHPGPQQPSMGMPRKEEPLL